MDKDMKKLIKALEDQGFEIRSRDRGSRRQGRRNARGNGLRLAEHSECPRPAQEGRVPSAGQPVDGRGREAKKAPPCPAGPSSILEEHMTEYNLMLELAKRKPTPDDIDVLMDAFADFHPSVGTSDVGWVEVTVTVQAESLRQAIATGLALAGDVVSVTGMTTAEFDRRPMTIAHAPSMSSVTEAAEYFGISRTAVQERIDRGTLPARKVGTTWVVLGLENIPRA